MNKEEIEEVLPHRDPFLFVDEVLDLMPGENIVVNYHFKESCDFYKGHFPDYPITPGVILVEAMAQASALILLVLPKFKNMLGYFLSIEKAIFKKPVFPNSTVTIKSKLIDGKLNIYKSHSEAFVNGEKVAEATLSTFFKKDPRKEK